MAAELAHVIVDDRWTLSPAYDLTRNTGMNGEHSTTVNGKGRNIGLDDLAAVGIDAGIPSARARSLAEEVRGIVDAALGD